MLFRWDATSPANQASPEQMQARMKSWQDWMGSIAAQGKMGSPGNRLSPDVKVVKASKVVTNGPYVEMKETLGGYILVKANDINDACELAKGCPVLAGGGNVEVRPIIPMDESH